MIKKLLSIFLPSVFITGFLQAQILSVSPGTDLTIAAGTTLSADSLLITPSSAFTMNGLSISKSATAVHTLSEPYISKVYQFSSASNPFSGVIQFYYDDAELNGLDEPTLETKIYDGASWQDITSAVNDVNNNYVLTNQVNNVSLEELTLVNPSGSLPLLWGPVAAYRQNRQVKVEWTTLQENNISHFNVERSADTRNWSGVNSDIAAANLLTTQHYAATDNNYNPARLYYRIKETDRDARVSYSPVVSVAAEANADIILYPNPVIRTFKLGITGTAAIKALLLYNSNGVRVRTWYVLQNAYNIEDLPAGVYQLKIVTDNNNDKILPLNKQ